jgi:hypothetical protein
MKARPDVWCPIPPCLELGRPVEENRNQHAYSFTIGPSAVSR